MKPHARHAGPDLEDGGCRLRVKGVPGGHQVHSCSGEPVHHPDCLFSCLPGVCRQQAKSTTRTPGATGCRQIDSAPTEGQAE